MTLDEAIAHAREVARVNRLRTKHPAVHRNDEDEIEACLLCAEAHEQLAEWLEKLKYIENIILKWNADIYNDEDTGIPDDEILEAIFNACTDNGFDIQIDEDYRNGYNKAIDEFAKALLLNTVVDKSVIRRVAEQLKEGGADA